MVGSGGVGDGDVIVIMIVIARNSDRDGKSKGDCESKIKARLMHIKKLLVTVIGQNITARDKARAHMHCCSFIVKRKHCRLNNPLIGSLLGEQTLKRNLRSRQ